MAQTPANALASHLISQIRSNLSLLEQLSVIQPQDADQIRTKLPPPNGPFPSLDSGAATGHNVGITVSSPLGHSPVHQHGHGMSGSASIEQDMSRLGLSTQSNNHNNNASAASQAGGVTFVI